jgi:hypothetical protein
MKKESVFWRKTSFLAQDKFSGARQVLPRVKVYRIAAVLNNKWKS